MCLRLVNLSARNTPPCMVLRLGHKAPGTLAISAPGCSTERRNAMLAPAAAHGSTPNNRPYERR
jgi:hypothetical protein